jgi:hypothetical protein
MTSVLPVIDSETVYVVASLPAANLASGQSAFCSDSTVAYSGSAIGTAVTGGGANFCRVYSDGTTWRHRVVPARRGCGKTACKCSCPHARPAGGDTSFRCPLFFKRSGRGQNGDNHGHAGGDGPGGATCGRRKRPPIKHLGYIRSKSCGQRKP